MGSLLAGFGYAGAGITYAVTRLVLGLSEGVASIALLVIVAFSTIWILAAVTRGVHRININPR